MKLRNSFSAFVLFLFAFFGATSTPVLAALPCNLHDPVDIELPAGSGEPVPTPPRPLEEILSGNDPADREGATKLTYDDGALRFNVVSAGENVLRCIDYGQDRVLIDNATSDFYSSRFEPEDIAIGKDLVEHGADGSITMVDVSNPLNLADGRYLVDVVFKHDGKWYTGELVFEQVRSDFYLDSSYLTKVEPTRSLLTIVVDEQGFPEDQLSIPGHTDVQVVNVTDEPFTLVVISEEDEKAVYRSKITPANLEGPQSDFILPTSEWTPGEYVASIDRSDESQLVISIVVEP